MKLTKLSQINRMHLRIYGERIRLIHQMVCDFYGITLADSCRHDRHNPFAKSRQFTHSLCRELLGQGCPLFIIGYVTGTPDEPYSHCAVLHSINRVNTYLYTKTPLDRYEYLDIKNEHQSIRGHVVYALSQLEKYGEVTHEAERKKVHISLGERSTVMEFGNQSLQRMDRHCKDTGITRSFFIRTAILDKLKKEYNGTFIQ